jgi:hypothetical protein
VLTLSWGRSIIETEAEAARFGIAPAAGNDAFFGRAARRSDQPNSVAVLLDSRYVEEQALVALGVATGK